MPSLHKYEQSRKSNIIVTGQDTMNVVLLKFCLISILLVLFIYQSWRTIMKYQAGKTSLQVNTTNTWFYFNWTEDKPKRLVWPTMEVFCSPRSPSVKTRCSTIQFTVITDYSKVSSPEKFPLRMRVPGLETERSPEAAWSSSWVSRQWRVPTTIPVMQWGVLGQESPAPFLSSTLTVSWWRRAASVS